MRLPLAVLICGALWAQETGLSPRDMFYRPLRPAIVGSEAGGRQNSGKGGRGAAVTPAAEHFGIRYNLLRFTDKDNNISEPVDPDGNFGLHDCFAIQLEPNRGGRLYVFNHAASGAWQVLLPNPEMPDESAVVTPGAQRRVPENHCYQVDGSRGTENLRVVLIDETAPPAAKESGTLVAQRLEKEFAQGSAMASRDLLIEKVGRPKAPGEPPNSVYIVQALVKGNRMIIDLKIRHE